MSITKEEVFKPGRVSQQDKASATDKAARQIIATEDAQRTKKSERLRLLREAQEVATPTPAPRTRRSK